MCLKCYYPESKEEDEDEELDGENNVDSDGCEPRHNHPLNKI